MAHNSFQRSLYNGLVLPAVYGALSLAAPFHSKLKATFRGRRNLRQRWQAAGRSMAERPVWFHVASVGEFEQARPVISELQKRYPQVPVAISVTSPSGYEYARRKEPLGDGSNVKFIDYLPIDFANNARFCLASLDPRLLVFVKFDLWPNLIWEAASREVPAILIDATLSESSYRLTALGTRFYRAVYEGLDRILAISEQDAGRFRACVPDHPGVSVAGDTRFDRVLERKQAAGELGLGMDKRNRFVVVAGSTWPKDEVHLLQPLARLAKDHDDVALIVAPHEPSNGRVDELRGWALANGLACATMSTRDRGDLFDNDQRVLIVDTVGSLAEMYRLGDAAYIGGSFSTGVHNVIEPAIMGMPVLFGPHHHNSFEALELLAHEGAHAVTNEHEILERLESLVTDREGARAMGGRAQSYVESQCGATGRCMSVVSEYL